jgi:hypothetical protein
MADMQGIILPGMPAPQRVDLPTLLRAMLHPAPIHIPAVERRLIMAAAPSTAGAARMEQ